MYAAVKRALDTNTGLAVGKLGTAEADMLYVHLNQHPYNGPLRVALTRNGGLWPATNQTLTSWSKHMQYDVLPYMDVIAEWYLSRIETPVLDEWAPQAIRLEGLEALDPWFGEPWTALIPPTATVAVVSPFADSIRRQISRISNIFPSPPFAQQWSNPPPQFVCVRTGCSPALDTKGPAAWDSETLAGGWRSAVHKLSQEVAEIPNIRVAIVGCGALSLPLVAALKKRGIIAVHMGGVTQTMFGIRGRRWNDHPIIGKLQEATNTAWISPSEAETPANSKQIEGGCYWA